MIKLKESQLRSQYGASARWFSPDQKVVDSYNAWYDHVKMKWEIGDLELDENGEPKWAGYHAICAERAG